LSDTPVGAPTAARYDTRDEMIERLVRRGDDDGTTGVREPREPRPAPPACGQPRLFSGDWIDRIIGLENVTVELAERLDGAPP
jgi:hypothetical protein